MKTSKAPPLVKELKVFQDGLCDIVKNLNFNRARNNFLNSLKSDIRSMRQEDRVLVSADKTGNHYWTDIDKYTKHLNNIITKDYMKVDDSVIDDIKLDDKKVD